MKKISVVLLMVVSLAFAAYAEAAKPKKRTRNANRVGPYATASLGQTSYPNDQTPYEQLLRDEFDGLDPQNLTSSSEDSDMGYQAAFGYRFTRYLAAEIALAQFGSAEARASADVDLGEGRGVAPVSLKLAFNTGGPVVSMLGILPINDKFELFGRLGYLFASSEREFASRVDGQSGGGFGPKGDSQDVVIGAGLNWHFGQVYSARLEYQQIDEVGNEQNTGTEDLRNITLGLVVRF